MTTRRLVRATIMLFCLAAASSKLKAQSADDARLGLTPIASMETASPVARINSDSSHRLLSRVPVWASPFASALIPGLGQARLDQDRFVGYMAVEAYVLLQYVKNRREANSNATAYRAIARDVARRTFPGAHPDTVFQYYEKLEKYLDSGAFSVGTSGATVPEPDTLTYNGQQWVLARQRFGIPLEDPNPIAASGYRDAVSYYESRAISQPYGWSWDNAQLEKDLFVRTIGRANDAYRRASYNLIALMANHVLSTIDAFASVRLLQATSNGMTVSASLRIP